MLLPHSCHKDIGWTCFIGSVDDIQTYKTVHKVMKSYNRYKICVCR